MVTHSNAGVLPLHLDSRHPRKKTRQHHSRAGRQHTSGVHYISVRCRTDCCRWVHRIGSAQKTEQQQAHISKDDCCAVLKVGHTQALDLLCMQEGPLPQTPAALLAAQQQLPSTHSPRGRCCQKGSSVHHRPSPRYCSTPRPHTSVGRHRSCCHMGGTRPPHMCPAHSPGPAHSRPGRTPCGLRCSTHC